MSVRPNHVPAVEWFDNAVDRFFFLRRESPEQAIPDNQNPGVVFVDVLWIAAVMYTVMRRSVQKPLEGTHPTDRTRVKPELADCIQRDRPERNFDRKSQCGKREIEEHAEESLQPR